MIIVTKLNRNGGQLSELDGTEWLYPPGAPSTGRAPKGALQSLTEGVFRITRIESETVLYSIPLGFTLPQIDRE